MERSLSDWYSFQLANPQSYYELAGARQGAALDNAAQHVPLEPVIDFDALREGFEKSKSLGLDDLSAPAKAAPLSSQPGPQIVPSSSASNPRSIALSGAVSLPTLGQHAGSAQDSAAAARSSSGPMSTSQKKLLQGRESQRRFREKAKAKSLAQQADLERAQAELAAVKARQKELESKNMLLESLSSLGSSSTSVQDADVATDRPGMFSAAELQMHHSQSPIHLTVHGSQESLTPQQIKQCSLPAFSRIWTDYMRELASCLLQSKQDARLPGASSNVPGSSTGHVPQRMQQLTAEASALMARMLLDAKMHKALMHGRMDEGMAAESKLDKAFYTNLVAAMHLTAAQVSDVMLLRSLYHTKRFALTREREALIQRMTQNEQGTIHPTEGLHTVASLAAELQMNASEEHQVHYRIALAVYTGILNTKQRAELMVLCYPWMPVLRILLDSCAPEDAPLYQELTKHADRHAMHVEWEQFTEYIKVVSAHTFGQVSHDYLPIQEQRGS